MSQHIAMCRRSVGVETLVGRSGHGCFARAPPHVVYLALMSNIRPSDKYSTTLMSCIILLCPVLIPCQIFHDTPVLYLALMSNIQPPLKYSTTLLPCILLQYFGPLSNIHHLPVLYRALLSSSPTLSNIPPLFYLAPVLAPLYHALLSDILQPPVNFVSLHYCPSILSVYTFATVLVYRVRT
jgi:hypothetical protein